MPSDLRERIPLRRFQDKDKKTEAHEHTTDTQLQHEWRQDGRVACTGVQRDPCRHSPANYDLAQAEARPRTGRSHLTCRGPQLSASDHRKPARSHVPSLRFCAPRTPASRAYGERGFCPCPATHSIAPHFTGRIRETSIRREVVGAVSYNVRILRVSNVPRAAVPETPRTRRQPSGPQRGPDGPSHHITRRPSFRPGQ